MSNLQRLDDGARSTDAAGFSFRQAKSDEVGAALRLILATGSRHATEAQVLDFLAFAVHRHINLSDVWIAHDGKRMSWAILPVPSPGRTMLLLAPPHVDGVEHCVGKLLDQVIEPYLQQGIELVQLLLDPQQPQAAEAYEQSNFHRLAELVYLQRSVPRRVTRPKLPPHWRWQDYSTDTHAQFVHTIRATYENSLDCPSLTGMRKMEDIVAGHKAAGEFHPSLWLMLMCGSASQNEPCGVLLLSPTPVSNSMELVYLGLCPIARGCGLGDTLLQQAFSLAREHGCKRLSLAVDALNTPALRLYQRHKFERVCSRLALLRDLRNDKRGA